MKENINESLFHDFMISRFQDALMIGYIITSDAPIFILWMEVSIQIKWGFIRGRPKKRVRVT